MNIIHLRAINERLDQVIQFRSHNDEDDDRMTVGGVAKNVAKTAGVAGVVGGGLYGYGKLMQHGDKVNPMEALRGGPLGGSWPAAKAGAMDLLGRGKSYAGNLGQEVKNVGTAVFKNKDIGIKAGLGELLKRAKDVRFSSRHTKLVELNARLDEVINFGQAFKKWEAGHDAAFDKSWQNNDDRDYDALDKELGRNSHRGTGKVLGTIAGASPLAVAMARRRFTLGGMMVGTGAALAGNIAGGAIGARIDRKHRPQELHAKLDALIQFGKESDKDDEDPRGKKKMKGKHFVFGKKKG